MAAEPFARTGAATGATGSATGAVTGVATAVATGVATDIGGGHAETAPLPARSIFDPAFLGALEGLRILARRVPPGGRHGEQRSRARGPGVEFTDVRPYTPGDDFRSIDWHLLQRLDRVFLRLYLQDEDLPVYFLLDQSRSMAQARVPGQSRSRTARQAVAALAYVTLQHMDRVSVYPFAAEALRPLPGLSGKHAFHRLLGYLAALPADGQTGMVEALRAFAHRRLRRGLCVVVSDGFDPRGAGAWLPLLAQIRHRVLVLRPVHPGEEQPELGGELEVVDCETGETVALTVDAAMRERYRTAYAEFAQSIDDRVRRLHGGVLTLQTQLPTVPQLQSLFRHGVLQA